MGVMLGLSSEKGAVKIPINSFFDFLSNPPILTKEAVPSL